jgi:tellurium resistance protein TerD
MQQLMTGENLALSCWQFYLRFKTALPSDIGLDVTGYLLNSQGKVRGDHDFIFYNQLKSQDNSVEHTGDNRSGQGDGDDETLLVNLSKVAPDVEKIAITVTIHDAQARSQNFGQIANAFIRIVNQDTQVEVVRFDLAEDYSSETAMVFGEVYRHNGGWKFKAVGQGYSGGLAAMCQQYGIQIG